MVSNWAVVDVHRMAKIVVIYILGDPYPPHRALMMSLTRETKVKLLMSDYEICCRVPICRLIHLTARRLMHVVRNGEQKFESEIADQSSLL